MTEEFWVESSTQSRFGKGVWNRVEGDDIDGETLDSVKIKFGQGTYGPDTLDIPVSDCTSQLIVSRDGTRFAVDSDVIEVEMDGSITATFILAPYDMAFGDYNLPKFEAHITMGSSMKKWTCTTCGYVAEDTQPPTKCPICGMSDFVTT